MIFADFSFSRVKKMSMFVKMSCMTVISIKNILEINKNRLKSRILKKKTLVIDKTGYLFYKNYIDDEFIFYLDKHNDDFADRVIEIYSSRNTIKKNLRLGIFNPFTGL